MGDKTKTSEVLLQFRFRIELRDSKDREGNHDITNEQEYHIKKE